MSNIQICKFYMDKGCEKKNCKYTHNPLLCIAYWANGKCDTQNCEYQHKLINKNCNNKNCNNKKCQFIHKDNNRLNKKKKNT